MIENPWNVFLESTTPMARLFMASAFGFTVLGTLIEWWTDPPLKVMLARDRRRERRRAWVANVTARALTALAADIAGHRRASDFESWLGDIVAASPGYGPLGPRDQVRYAAGLVHAGVRMRTNDAGAALGGVLDRWLVSDLKVCGTAVLVCLGAAGRLWLDGGFLGVVVNGHALAALTAAPWGIAVVLRRVRGVEPRRRRRDVGVGGGKTGTEWRP